MKISIQLFVTPRKAVTIESSDFETTDDCMEELRREAVINPKLEQVKQDLISLFGSEPQKEKNVQATQLKDVSSEERVRAFFLIYGIPDQRRQDRERYEMSKTANPPTASEQIKKVWQDWRNKEEYNASTAMLTINAILLADGERERQLKMISEDERRDREVRGL